jgi:hypothetical protein
MIFECQVRSVFSSVCYCIYCTFLVWNVNLKLVGFLTISRTCENRTFPPRQWL